jgi:hypothetical protein
MRNTLLDWEAEHVGWLKPFLDGLGHKARRRMCPLNVTGVDWPRRPQENSADGGVCQATMISCTPLSLLVSGTQHR